MLQGRGGIIEFDLGGGRRVLGEAEAWSLSLNRETLPTSPLNLESDTYIKGKKNHTGTVNYLVRLYEDSQKLSAAQLIPLILDTENSGINVQARFYLGRQVEDHWMRNVATPVLDESPYLGGNIILETTAIECPASDLITCRSSFRVNGELSWVEATYVAPPLLPNYGITPALGVYTQSSVNAGNVAATAASMTNNTVAATTETATNSGIGQFVQIDYGTLKNMNAVVLGAPDGSLTGGWGSTGAFTTNLIVETSTNGTTWTGIGVRVVTAGTSAPSGVAVFAYTPASGVFTVPFPGGPRLARYIRVRTAVANNLALTEFYATSVV
jgi:Flp pilus assembly protein TadG